MPSKLSQLIEETLRGVVKGYTAHPESIEIDTVELDTSITLTLRVDLADYPKVLGKQGRHIRALQTLFAYAGEDRPVRVTLLKSTKGQIEEKVPFTERLEWDSAPTRGVLASVVYLMGASSIRDTKTNGLNTTFIVVCQPGAPLRGYKVQEALSIILEIIGKKEGRLIYIDFVQQ